MRKLSIRERCIILLIVFAMAGYAGYQYLWIPAQEKTKHLKTQVEELRKTLGDQGLLESQITEKRNECAALEETIAALRTEQSGNNVNKEDFLVYLGRMCNENGVEVIHFNDLGTVEEDGVWKFRTDFELRGTMPALNMICEAIEKMNVRYSVGGMSLRQDEDNPYLTRFFDGISKLEWYTPAEQEEQEAEPTASPHKEQEVQITPFPEVDLSEFDEIVHPTPEPDKAVIQEEAPPEDTLATPTPEPEQTPEPEPETLTGRLDALLEQTSFKPNTIHPQLLTNKAARGKYMRLNVTIQFTSYVDPQDTAYSFRIRMGGDDAVL